MDSTVSALDTTAAEAYERYLVPPVFGPWAEYVVKVAALRPGEDVLDLACGTGVAARRAAQRTGKAVGVDIDPAMIEVARRHDTPRQPVEWRCGDACRLGLDDGTFDACLCVQGLQHFSDRERALAEIRRVLKPTGRFVAAAWSRIEETPGLLAVLSALEQEQIDASPFRRPFALGDAGGLELLVRRAGFTGVRVHRHEKPARFASIEAFLFALKTGSAASRGALELVSPLRWSAFTTAVRDRVADYVRADGLEFPYSAHIVVAGW
jgi:SAM-dependent methyltransferase